MYLLLGRQSQRCLCRRVLLKFHWDLAWERKSDKHKMGFDTHRACTPSKSECQDSQDINTIPGNCSFNSGRSTISVIEGAYNSSQLMTSFPPTGRVWLAIVRLMSLQCGGNVKLWTWSHHKQGTAQQISRSAWMILVHVKHGFLMDVTPFRHSVGRGLTQASGNDATGSSNQENCKQKPGSHLELLHIHICVLSWWRRCDSEGDFHAPRWAALMRKLLQLLLDVNSSFYHFPPGLSNLSVFNSF